MSLINVVSNTSPLIFLQKINSLKLLEHCFQNVVVPESVALESGITDLPSFVQVKAISEVGRSFVDGAIGRLHRGELEAIRLAQELNYKVVLLDDLLARRYAERQSLVPLGVLGVLKVAYRFDLLSFEELKTKVDELTNQHSLYVSQKVLEQYWKSYEE